MKTVESMPRGLKPTSFFRGLMPGINPRPTTRRDRPVCVSLGLFVVSHPSDKNKYVARVGHPAPRFVDERTKDRAGFVVFPPLRPSAWRKDGARSFQGLDVASHPFQDEAVKRIGTQSRGRVREKQTPFGNDNKIARTRSKAKTRRGSWFPTLAPKCLAQRWGMGLLRLGRSIPPFSG